jgi:hypothetical protein
VRARRLLIPLVVAAALWAGCGSDDPEGAKLPADAVTELDRRLDEILRRFEEGTENANVGACSQIQTDSFRAIADTINGLPQDVDSEIRNALTESFRNLQTLTRDGCADAENQQTEPETTPEAETTPDETATDETTPTEPTTPETTPTTPTTPDTGGDGGGTDQGGDGQGGGSEAPQGEDDDG